jgi:hypothetical protein
MASAIVLTDKATFQCAHMPKAIGTDQGITISLTASKTTVAGAKPILNGATIGGFTLAAGCTFGVTPATPNGTPCLQFMLSAAPASGLLTDSGQKVYTEADLSAIAAVPSAGNAVPGLVINESQSKLKA